MRHKGWYFIEFKYGGEPWIEYDRTQVPNWAETQQERCKKEHPLALIRVRFENK